MAKLRFNPNEPLEIAIKKDGEPAPSNFEGGQDQVKFLLCGGDIWYAPQVCADKMTKLGIKPFEPFRVCKRVVNGVTRWEVDRVPESETETEQQLRDSLAQRANPSKVAPAAPTPGPQLVSGPDTTNRTNGQTTLSTLLSGCMVAAIDAAVVARDYAHTKGLTIALTEESIQDLTSTLMIHLQRMAELELKYDVKAEQALNRVQNGGNRWRQ